MIHPDGVGWQRLDPRMLAVLPLRQVGTFLPVIAVVLLVGSGDLDGRLVGLVAVVLLLVAAGVARWFTTRYRITAERVELHAGLLVRSRRSVPRDRIRTVDLTAGPVHRLFGLAVLRIATGQRTEGSDGELALDAVSAAEADRLRRALLRRETYEGAPAVPMVDQPEDTGGTALARLDLRWLRYAPLTVSSLVAVGAVAGAVGQLVGELDIDPAELPGLQDAREQLDRGALWLGVVAFAVLILGIAVLGSLLIFLERWWGFRLTREPDGTLRVRRGLLTTRSISLEERRLRGVELAEPLLLRAGRGARATAVSTGLGGANRDESRGSLLPPAPLAEAHRVAAVVLEENRDPTALPLRAHPAAALRRRLLRAVLPVLVAVLALWVSIWASDRVAAAVPAWVPWAVLAAAPVTALLAVDAYRNLGHALTPRYLVARQGTFVRRTVALQRDGLIGWAVSQSLFQRRMGLATLTAITAAGSGGYQVLDVGLGDGLAFADQVVPGLVGQFLADPRPTRTGSEAPHG